MTGSMYETLKSGPEFDVRETPTGMGKIAETLRRDKRSRRSIHPTHSVVALGCPRRLAGGGPSPLPLRV